MLRKLGTFVEMVDTYLTVTFEFSLVDPLNNFRSHDNS